MNPLNDHMIRRAMFAAASGATVIADRAVIAAPDRYYLNP
jgi:hypothetical protein